MPDTQSINFGDDWKVEFTDSGDAVFTYQPSGMTVTLTNKGEIQADGLNLNPQDLSGVSGDAIGDVRMDDGTNTTSGKAGPCTWVDTTGDGSGDSWQDTQGGTF